MPIFLHRCICNDVRIFVLHADTKVNKILAMKLFIADKIFQYTIENYNSMKEKIQLFEFQSFKNIFTPIK